MADIESNIRIGFDTASALAAIKNLQREISAFHTSIAKGSSAAAQATSNLQKDLISGINATGQFSASMTKVRSSAESFTNALEKNKLSMGEYFRFAGGATKTFGKNFTSEFNTIEKVARERVKDLQTQFISLGRDANGSLQAIKVRPLVLDLKDAGTQMQIAAQKQQIFNQLLKQGSTNLLNFGKNTQWAGRQLMVGFTLPLTVFGQVAAKTFMDLEKQALRFKRVYGELFTSPEETDSMVKALQELSLEFTKYGVAVEKTMGLAADAAAMGKTGTELLSQVTEANRLAVLGNVEQAQALETTISVTNAFGTATEDLANKIDFLNAVENQTVTSIEDLTIAIPKAGPVVKQLGGDVEDLAFFLTAMKEGGINASEGANALKSGLASLINPTGRAAEMLAGFGININKIVEANKGDVKGVVIDFANALDTLDPLNRARAIEQLFGKFQFSRLSTLFQNVIAEGTQAERVLALANSTVAELSALSSKELGNVADSTTFRFQKAIEELKMAIAPIGEQFLKAITPIIEFGTSILNTFNSMGEGVKNFVVLGGALLAGLGPVVLMTFGLIANGVANLIKGFAAVRGLFLKTKDSSTVLGEQLEYMSQEQVQAASIASSLEQAHSKLEQRFTSEAAAVNNLRAAYERAIRAQQAFSGLPRVARSKTGETPTGYKSGVVSVPGPKGAGDIIPAMLAPGEAVIPAAMAQKYAPLIEGMVAGNLPGYRKGVVNLGMPRSGKSTGKNRDAAEQVYQMFLQSSYRDTAPTNYGHQLSPTSGHSFPIFGLGGVYMGPGGEKVFVKPVMDETAALAEIRGTQIARQAHGLKAPEQRIVVIRDPQDVTGTRRFLALESKLDSTFVNNDPMALFNEEQYFKQLVASLLRVDKDLAAGNMFGDVVADVGPAGVFDRASGVRQYKTDLPSMEQQAMINLLGIKGGAKRAFAESTLGLMAGLTPQQYHQRMISEIQQVLPLLRQTVASFGLTNPAEADAYNSMIRRLEQGLSTDWSKFHAIHSAVKITPPKQTAKPVAIPGYADGVVSVPGPKGKGDVVPAMLSPGEAVIPTKMAKKYAPLINAMISGNIPGYVKGLSVGSVAKDLRQPGGRATDKTVNASHIAGLEATELPGTLLAIAAIDEKFGDMVVPVTTLTPVLDEFGNQVTKAVEIVDEATGQVKQSVKLMFDDIKENVKIKDLDPSKQMMVQGLAFGGTAIPESQRRNKDAYQAAGIAAAPFTLEQSSEAGQKAASALASRNDLADEVVKELQLLVEQGRQARLLLSEENAATADLTYSKEVAASAIEFAINQDTSSNLSASEARQEAERRTAAVLVQYQKDIKDGIAEEDALANARLRLQKEMVTASENLSFTAFEEGGSRDLGRPYNTKGPKAIKSGSRGQLIDPNKNKVARGRDTASAVARMGMVGAESSEEVFLNIAQTATPSASALAAAAEAGKSGAFKIHTEVVKEIKQGLGAKSPSREFESISKDVSDGVRLGSDDATAAGEQLAKTVSQSVTRSGSSFVKPATQAPTQTESYQVRKVQAPVPFDKSAAINVAQNAGQDSMGPLKAYFTMVGANLRAVGQEFKAEMGITTSETMGPLKAYFTTVRANLRDSLRDSQQEFRSIFANSSDLASAGLTASQKFRAGLEAANPQLVIEGKKAGINYAAALSGQQGGIAAVLTKKNAELITAATTAWNAGIRDLPKQGVSLFKIAGGSISQEIARSAIERARQLAPAVGGSIAQAAQGAFGMPNVGAKFGITAGETGESSDLKSRPKSGFENFQALNSQLMTLSFAFSSVATVTSMFGEDMGFLNDALYGFSNGVLALTGVIQLLTVFQGGQLKELAKQIVTTATNTAAWIANTRAVMQNSIAQTFSGGMLSGFGKIGGKLSGIFSKLLLNFGRFLPMIGVAIAAFSLFKVIADGQEEQRQRIEGMGNAATLAGEKLEAFAKIAGFTATRDPSGTFDATNAQAGTGLTSKEAEQSVDIRATEDFKNEVKSGGQFYTDVQNLKNATVAEAQAAMSSLMIKAIALAPEGTDIGTIKATVAAIAAEAGKSGISLELPVTLNPFEQGNEEKVLSYVKELRNNPEFQLDIGGTQGQSAQLTTDAQKSDASLFGASVFAGIQQLNTQLNSGNMTATEYKVSVAGVLAEVKSLGEVSQQIATTKMFEGFGVPEDVIKGVTDLEARLLMLQAYSLGVGPTEAEIKALDAADDADASGAERQAGLEIEARLRRDTAKAIKDNVDALKAKEKADKAVQAAVDLSELEAELEANDKTNEMLPKLEKKGLALADAYDMLADAKRRNLIEDAISKDQERGDGLDTELDRVLGVIATVDKAREDQEKAIAAAKAPEDLDAYLDNLEKEKQLKEDLEAKGLSAADVQTTLTTEVLAAAAAAAIASGNFDEYLLDLERYNKLAPRETSGGGTPDKTPFEEATESLKNQQVELRNTISAYSKLRKSGFDISTAFKTAQNPVLATALAGEKINTEKWRELVGLIREYNNLQKKVTLSDLIKQNISAATDESRINRIQAGLSKLGLTADQISRVVDQIGDDPNLLARFANDLRDGKINSEEISNYLKGIKNLDVKVKIAVTKEEIEAEADNAFSMVNEAFSSKKALIEVDFEQGTNESQLNPDKINTDALEEGIKKSEKFIQEQNDKISDNEYLLEGIQEQEDSINKRYDERLEAIDAIAEANEKVSAAQQSQLSISSALARGDVASAAKLMQEQQERERQEALEKRRSDIEKSREQELSSIRGTDGRTRTQIEAEIKDLKRQVRIEEEENLKPQQKSLDIANEILDKAIDSIDVLGLNEKAWGAIEAKARAARVEAEAYEKAILGSLRSGNVNTLGKLALPEPPAAKDDKKVVVKDDKKVVVKDDKKVVKDDRPGATGNKNQKPSADPGTGFIWSQDKSGKWTKKAVTKPAAKEGFKISWNSQTGTWSQTPSARPLNTPKGRDWAWDKGSETWKLGAESPLGSSANPYTTGVMPGASIPPGTRTLSVPMGKFVKMPFGLYMHGMSAGKNGEVLLRYGSEENNIGKDGAPQKIAGNVIRIERDLSGNLPGLARFNAGGFVSGPGTPTSDSIPAMLSDGEYVVKASSVDKIGSNVLEFLNNNGKLPGFAEGGMPSSNGKSMGADPKLINAVRQKLDIVRATEKMVTRSINPNLDLELQDPANVKPMQGRALGPGMYFAPNASISERFWKGLGGTAYSPKVGMLDAIRLMSSKGYASAQDVSSLGVRLDRGDNVTSPSVRKLMDAGYIGYRGNAKPDLSDANEVTNWKIGAKNGFGLKKILSATAGKSFGALNILGLLPTLHDAGLTMSGKKSNPVMDRTSARYAMGGLVKPQYFNAGGMVKGYSRGGDVVPSMLTPGEFVMSKFAVQNYGLDKMKAINSGTYNGDSVYNYSVNVNVQSESNPDEIARTVMTQIKRINDQQIRSYRA